MNQRFLDQLNVYKISIDETIKTNTEGLGLPEAYSALLRRGGKRIRGALVMVGYEMLGGKDRQMILQASLAIEMMHVYILIIDDIQDRSDTRRGGPTVHKYLENKSIENGWSGNHAHTGISLALNEALIGAHEAHKLIISMDIDPEIRLKAVELINQTMSITAQGQTGDIINEVGPVPDMQAIDNVLLNKTARYTILNPLQVGMTLAGSGEVWWPPLTQYAEAAGRVFQITDDLLIFSEDQDKDPAGDIREGKMTHIALHALSHCSGQDRSFLKSQLGNPKLAPAEFTRVKKIFISSGAKDYAEAEVRTWTAAATVSLKDVPDNWDTAQVDFLRELVQSFAGRVR